MFVLDLLCFVGVCSIILFHVPMFSFFFFFCGNIRTIKRRQIGRLKHNSFKFVKLCQEAEHGVAKKDEWKRSEKTRRLWERCISLPGSSGRLGALPCPSCFSLGRPCSPLSALGERKRTKDLLLGPDLYTFLVLFFSPRPLGHTKGL